MEPRHVKDVIDAFEQPTSSLSHYIFVSTNMVVSCRQPFYQSRSTLTRGANCSTAVPWRPRWIRHISDPPYSSRECS
jgi:hypothetical protein